MNNENENEALKLEYTVGGMPQVTNATQLVLCRLKKKAAELPLSAHPYSDVLERREQLGLTEWNDKHTAAAQHGLSEWAVETVGRSMAEVIAELVKVVRAGEESYDDQVKEATQNLGTSLEFIMMISKCFFESINFAEIGEELFKDGEAAYKQRAEEEAAAEAAKARVRRTAPSAN